MRTGSELVRATKPYAEEDIARSWRLLISTSLIQALVLTLTVLAPWWPVKLVGSVILGLIVVRLFIFFHDYMHGAIFRESSLGKWAMYAVGVYTMSPPSVWKESHNYHHQNTAKLLGSSIGSYPTVTVGMWKAMKPKQRVGYKIMRHPLTIVLGTLTTFVLGMCIAPFKRDPKGHWIAPVVMVLWFSVFAVLGLTLGWTNAVFAYLLPGLISSASGSYLFYAQHNFPGIELVDRRHWSYNHAALRCSSMMDMSPLMHWFTGNIGYHHVHHLNHKIPFYRLPEAMAAMPELQDPIRTSLKPADIVACLRLKLWDPESKQMVSFSEAEAMLAAKAA